MEKTREGENKLKTLLLTGVLGVMAFGLTGCGQGKVSNEQKEHVIFMRVA